MAVLRPDDPIYRAPGYWIDNRGSEMPIVARYATWIVGGLTFLPFFVAARMIGLGWLMSVVIAGLAAGGLGRWVADRLNGEHTVRSWLMTGHAMLLSARYSRCHTNIPRRHRRTYR